jgi:hypothetical protein
MDKFIDPNSFTDFTFSFIVPPFNTQYRLGFAGDNTGVLIRRWVELGKIV